MTGWPADDLATLDAAASVELEPSSRFPRQSERVELGIVTVGDAAYIRAYRGPESRWFQASLTAAQGFIVAGSLTAEVRFELADPELVDEVDAAYRAKYGHLGVAAIGLVLSSSARAATLRITPRRT